MPSSSQYSATSKLPFLFVNCRRTTCTFGTRSSILILAGDLHGTIRQMIDAIQFPILRYLETALFVRELPADDLHIRATVFNLDFAARVEDLRHQQGFAIGHLGSGELQFPMTNPRRNASNYPFRQP